MDPAYRLARKAITAKFSPLISLISLSVLLSALAIPAHAGARQQQTEQRNPLGTLTTSGTVQVNGATAPAQSTVLAGDSLNTEQGGTATLTITSKGTIKVYPETRVVFGGNSVYVAELIRGTAVTNSLAGTDGVGLRIGDYVVRAAPGALQAAAMVRLETNGESVVSCIGGTIGVDDLHGSTSVILGLGQSTSISTLSQAIAVQAPAVSTSFVGEVGRRTGHNRRLIVLGIAGAAAVVAAIAITHGSSHAVSQSRSPSPPSSPNPPAPNPPAPNPPAPNPPAPNPPTPNPPAPNPPAPNPPAPNPPAPNPPAPQPPPPPKHHKH